MLLLLFICLLASMTLAVKVAVIGGGVSGSNFCAALRQHLQKGSSVGEIDVYDKGRVLGGRASTRMHTHHGNKYNFDHGAQYIGKGGESFRSTLDQWLKQGYINPWPCRLGSWERGRGLVGLPDEDRYVPVGGFSALCQRLVEDSGATLRKEVDVSVERRNGCWSIIDTRTRETLADGYDHVVFTDRSTVLSHKHLFSTLEQQEFYASVSALQQRPLLSLMVVFDADSSKRLEAALPFGGCKFVDHPVLGWVARDSSKPGRHREDGRSCFVIQSQYAFAEELIRSVGEDCPGASFEQLRQAIASACEMPLLNAFFDLCSSGVMKGTKPMFIRGHRWGAAMSTGQQPAVNNPQQNCFFDYSSGLIAVGDYLARQGSGKIEGAVLSSAEAAYALASRSNK